MKPVDCSSERFTEYYLDLRKSALLVKAFIAQYNQERPLREQLRPHHRDLICELLNIYRTVVWGHLSDNPLVSPGIPLPYLSVNNVHLGKEVGCSERTIQNLRQRLWEAGLILDEIWHGSKANYEIRLNPEIIFLGRRGDRQNWISLFEGKAMTVEVNVAEKGHQYSGATNITDGDQQKTEDPEQQITDATEVWKTAATPVEIPLKPAIQQRADPPSYEEKNTVFSENLSSKCTLSLPDTNQLNQLEVDRCGKGAGTDVDRAGGQRRLFFTGYETIGDSRDTPPRVARRPPGGDGVSGRFGDGEMSDMVKGDAVSGREHGAGGWEQGAWSPHKVQPLHTGSATRGVSGGEQGVPQTFGEVVAGLPDKLGRRIFREVSKVWALALEELYAGEWIADTERERAMARLAEYYVDARPERYAAGTAEIYERIRLVRKWIERGRQQGLERWVLIPSVYFDHRNTRGFSRTKVWFKKHMEKRREIGDKIAVARAVRRYERCLRGEDRSQGPMEVYQELVDRLRERGEGVMMRFCDMV